MERIKILDKEFELTLHSSKIQKRIKELADEISNDLKDKDPLFISILNGSFIFAADIFKKMSIDARISFIKLASYQGIESSGLPQLLIGLNIDIMDMNIVILEDIVETGTTLEAIIDYIKGFKPGSIRVITLLFKPGTYKANVHLDYVGFSIPNNFVVGYGLDYNGFGRGLEDIYRVVDKG